MKTRIWILSVLLLCAAVLAVLYFRCRAVPVLPSESSPAPVAAGQELLCTADSQEEAEAVAAQYDITLVSFDLGIAVFTTQEDPRAVIARGQEQGLPPLSLNYISSIH